MKPSYQTVRGMQMPLGFPVDALESSFGFRPDSGDVVLATYPKCGTTWMQHILYMLFHGGREIPENQSVRELVPHLEEMGADFVRAVPTPRLIKTHLQCAEPLFHGAARYVAVFRNPFDCAVSFFHHTRGFVKHYDFADGTFGEFLDVFVSGDVDFGGYFDHVASWLAVCDAPNVHWTTFERMKSDLAGEITSLARFLGGAPAATAADAGALAGIVEAAGFSNMARAQQRWSSARPDGMTAFVRKGIVGDWRRHFTPATMRPLLALAQTRLSGTVLAREWSDLLSDAQAFCQSDS